MTGACIEARHAARTPTMLALQAVVAAAFIHVNPITHRHLQAEPSMRAIPVIALSADATPRQIERLLADGATAYLAKSLDLKEFLSVVEQTLEETRH